MILRFLLENYASFQGEAEVSFVSTSRKDEPAWRFESPHVPHGVLPAVGVWGANASGKSNLLRGLMALRHLVKSSFVDFGPTDPVPWTPFRLDRSAGAPATRMEIDFTIGDVRFQLGLRLDGLGFAEEWLYRWEKSHRQVLYHRQRGEAFYFGPSLKGQRAQIAEQTRTNSLFLSAAAQHNHEQLLPVYEALVQGIQVEHRVRLHGFPLFHPSHPLLDPAHAGLLQRLLRVADVGIASVRAEPHEGPPMPTAADSIFQPDFLARLREDRPTLMRLVLDHGEGDDAWELPPEAESRGTQILLVRLADIVEALQGGRLLVIDELDTSLHPDLCAVIVDLFTDPRCNPKGAQLFFSTHDRDVLARLRTDEVILVDKDRAGVSSVRVASDYRGVRTRDDLRRAHALGRIRGVPVLGDMAGILETASR
ncbi:MAG: ATP-binding protein [bacterium]